MERAKKRQGNKSDHKTASTKQHQCNEVICKVNNFEKSYEKTLQIFNTFSEKSSVAMTRIRLLLEDLLNFSLADCLNVSTKFELRFDEVATNDNSPFVIS